MIGTCDEGAIAFRDLTGCLTDLTRDYHLGDNEVSRTVETKVKALTERASVDVFPSEVSRELGTMATERYRTEYVDRQFVCDYRALAAEEVIPLAGYW